MTMLTLDNLTYQRGDFTLHADLALESNKRYVLSAPSGSGKSTLLDLIAGFIQPQQGRILLNEQDLTPKPVERRPVSYLFQKHNLFDHLTVRKNLRLAAKKLPEESLIAALDNVSLPTNYLDKLPDQLSGGEQQRVALARTLLMNRPIMLLDEPYSALDLDTRIHITDLTRRLQAEHGWLLLAVSHDPDDCKRLDAQSLTIKNQYVIMQGNSK
ncbi:ATP-binding cassette domain-containing protein [Cardiobacteriaceae bacterium TAE3-ERU3]|nr:ATP-binding cassette domain-containing protein [Cardiobacteriaceae bacterium TAE3-ERU3]